MILTSWASHTRRSNPNPSTRVHPRSEEMDADVLQRWTGIVGCSEQTEAQAMCCERMHVAFVARNPNPCYASVFAKRSDGRTCAAAMDGHTWAAVNGRKYKRVVNFASFGRDSNLCDDFASVGRDANLCDESASEQRRDGPTCAAAMGNTRRTAVISLDYVVVGMQTSSCEQTRSSWVTSCEQTDAAHL